MKGYILGSITVTDPELYQQYARQVPAVISSFGGRYLVRGGSVEPLEGDWAPNRAVVLEFDSPDDARAFYRSPEYQELVAIRQRASTGSLALVDGI
jgi:uncharacterized protein (DUF1330 family)